jgi:hypothetical protein
MKYKVGDKVRIQSKEWYESHKNKFGKIWTVCLSGEGTICFDQDNAKYCGKEVTIFSVEPDNYVLRGIPYEWTDEMIEGLAEEEVGLVDNLSSRWVNEFELPDGYIFKDENGNVINATKIVLEKKKKEYPKTYEELVSLVKRMREAQSDYEIIDMSYEYAKDHQCADRELVLQRAEAMTKAIKLEDEVDEYLKKMEEEK